MKSGRVLLAVALLVATTTTSSGQKATYTIVAPTVVRPNTDYLVAVSTFNIGAQEQQNFELRITGRSESGQTIDIREDTTVASDQTQIVRIRIGDLGQGSYTLTARGRSPIEFDQSQKLEYVHKGYSIFIQTDKAIYRPGNKVKFRAIVVSPKLKPSVIGSIDVYVHDGAGNLIRKWDRVFTTQGVFAGEFDLAGSPIGPVLGDWNITVDVTGQTASKKFQVAEYVLPKFAIDIELPDYGNLGEPSTRVVIVAKQASGEPVVGEATIAVFPKYKSSSLQPVFSEPIRKVVDISGRVEVTFDNLAKDLGLAEDYTRQVVFDVHVKEENTERIQNATAVFSMFRYDYKLQLVKTADAFRPGMPFVAYLKVAHQDDRPINDDLNVVSVKWGFGQDTSKYNNTEYSIPDDGIIKLKFMPPANSENSVLGIEAKYKDLDQWFSTIPSAVSSSKNYIQAVLKTQYPEVGSNVRIGVSSTGPLESLTYAVFGRGNLVFAETLKGSETDFNEISFKATSDMAPRCRLVVYFVAKDGEIVADALEFEVAGTLTNFVEVFTSRRQSFPGKSVTVNVKSKPNTFVGLMAVDARVNSLNLGHDFTMEDVIDEIRSYDSARDPSFIPWFKLIKPKTESLQWHTGSSGSKQVFDDSSTAILTNGALQKGRETISDETKIASTGGNRPVGRPIPKPGANTVNPDQGPGIEYETVTRPPLAGPYAFSKLPKPVDDLPKFYLKRDIPETWLFMNTTTDLDGKASIPVTAPDLTNSSWVITGFALDDLNGMGISAEPGLLDIFQPFYVQVDLPHSVKLGETLAVEMVVYNYLKKEVSAEVTLENTEDSAFVFGSKDANAIDGSGPAVDLFRTKRVEIRPGRGTLVSFLITPVKIGLLDIKITAKSSVGQDILIKKLLVDPPGDTIYMNKAVFLDLRAPEFANTPLEKNISINIPKTAVKGSERIFVSSAPDPMGPPINNLKNLLNIPPGGGEQNLLKLMPAVILADYMKKSGSFQGKLEATTKQLLETGYQQQLTYKLEDGSFSPFGHSVDRRGSIWITALTVSALRLADSYTSIDPNVIATALAWLVKNQAQNGSFPETGPMTYKLVQDDPISTTAYVVLAFFDNKQSLDGNSRNSLNKGINYLAENWDSIDPKVNPHSLALVTYALHLALHPEKDQAFRLLDSIAQIKDGKKWWQMHLEDFEKGNPWTTVPNSVNIEMTGFALLSMLNREDSKFEESIPVVNWMLEQQNAQGGFASTPDTYVGLLALREFSSKLRIAERGTQINLQYSYLQTVRTVEIDSSKQTIVQKRILPAETRELRLRATGGGVGLVQVGYEYNVEVTGAWPSFVVNPQVFRVSTSDNMKVTVCANYIEGGSASSSNMAVMEIYLPSGFTVDRDSLYALRRYKGIKRVDPEVGDTKVVLYFESIGRSEVCPTISAYRTHRVANQKPATVLVYDYYDQTRRARAFYEPVPATLCEICLGEDCPDDGCPDRQRTVNSFNSLTYGANVDRLESDSGASEIGHNLALNLALLALLRNLLRH